MDKVGKSSSGAIMPEFLRRSWASFSGPWLLDVESLNAFDAIIDERLPQLQELRRQELEVAVAEDLAERLERFPTLTEPKNEQLVAERRKIVEDRYQFKQERKLTLDLKSGEKLVVERFNDAFLNTHVQNTWVTGFEFELRCAATSARVKLGASDDVTVSTAPESSDAAADLFLRLEEWAKNQAPSVPIWFWNKFGSFLISTLLLIFCFFLVARELAPSSSAAKTRQEARDLLKKGMAKDDEHRAIELLLALAAEYFPDKAETADKTGSANSKISVLPLVVIGSELFLLSLSLFPPKSVFAIGRGKDTLKQYKMWIGFVSKAIVAFLVLGVFSSILAGLILR